MRASALVLGEDAGLSLSDGPAVLPRLDIVIVNWNAGPLLRDCVASVLAADCSGFVLDRVVVVDNASEDGSLSSLPLDHPAVTIVRNPDNRGFAVACNQGAARSAADYLLFLNPDVRLDRGSLCGAVAFMEQGGNQGIEISGIRLRAPDGQTQRCCARFPTVGRLLAHSIGLDRLVPRLVAPHFMTEWDHQDSREVPQVMGAFLMIRRGAFQRLGGFDERFFLYYEDVDLCWRLSRSGGRCAHNAAVSAVHVGGGTTRAILARRQFLAAASRIQFSRKHFGGKALAVAAAALTVEPLARLGHALLRRAPGEIADTLAATLMLWRAVPRLWAPAPAPAPNPPAPLKVLALPRYSRRGASSRTRFLAFQAALGAAGFTIELSPFFDESYLADLYNSRPRKLLQIVGFYRRRLAVLRRCRSYDLVWIEKEALPWLPLAIEAFLLRKVRLVVDFDDAWFLRYRRHPLGFLLGGKLEGLARRATTVVVGNDYLAQWARRAGAVQVAQLPTAVPLDRYVPARRPAVARRLRIGWIGTPSSAELYLGGLAPVLVQAVAAGWADVTIVGAIHPALAKAGVATFLPWSEEREVDLLHQFDVGVMPLVDDGWSQGKCAYKLLQYMAVGLPVVASPVGMNRKVVQPGVNGFLASTPQEWLAALRTLAEDAELRRTMGEAGRRLVERDYAVSIQEPRLVATLRQAAGRAAVAPVGW